MPLIKSISGFRGTIGGRPGDNLTPQDIVECTAAFGQWVLTTVGKPCIVVGRDGRISGDIVSALVINTLRAMGISVVDLGLSTTPTVEIAVPMEKAGGGIILTASHNPKEWNALKLLNHKGEFISGKDGAAVLDLVAQQNVKYATVDKLGEYRQDDTYLRKHIEKILALPLVDVEAVRAKGYKIVVDAINSTGALAVPPLLEALGCQAILLNGEVNGHFNHNPEPLKEHLGQLSTEVRLQKANMGIAVDPDVDRLVFMCEDGELFGEEYTLVAVADYVLSKKKGNTVSNLSSSRALRDVTLKHGGEYFASAVGEVHVVEKMKAVKAVIGGEGNGGVILPELHYGRDALVGIALFLTHLAKSGRQISTLRKTYPDYQMAKTKIERTPDIDLEKIFTALKEKYQREQINTEDGLKIDFEQGWVHLRPSNTEPIIRVYSESNSIVVAENLAKKIIQDIQQLR
ncbi:MAG: phosphoglucosamine mutase [Haliscomenobacteraceae bacterium CHB4]|nr:Phosphomannomutase/phosphoglucomutase [Saprospiraceae bacterium]MCE7924919.1 phosphoglucosamine mutase [Haliscomenobacteraceae bacterium CHB4]